MTTRAAATETLRTMGIAPRGMTRAVAAAYVGLSERAFAQRVKDGRLPGPHPATGRWDRIAIDAALGGPRETAHTLDEDIMAAIENAPAV